VPIQIKKHGDEYVATVTPPHGSGAHWQSLALSRPALVAEPRAHGCHTTDIGDAFYAADPDRLNE
jgi:hypothetical protein